MLYGCRRIEPISKAAQLAAYPFLAAPLTVGMVILDVLDMIFKLTSHPKSSLLIMCGKQ